MRRAPLPGTDQGGGYYSTASPLRHQAGSLSVNGEQPAQRDEPGPSYRQHVPLRMRRS